MNTSPPKTAGRYPTFRRPTVQVIADPISTVLKAYTAEQDPMARGIIYQRELEPILAKGDSIPFDRVPYTADNALGTMVGSIVAQRTLSLMSSRRPILRSIGLDLSAESAVLGETIHVRATGLPDVRDFGQDPTDTADLDYPLTLSEHKQVEFRFRASEYNATNRNLVEEHAKACELSLGDYLSYAALWLITDDFTSSTSIATASFDFSTLCSVVTAMNLAGVPDFRRRGFINSDLAQVFKNDDLIMAGYERDNTTAYGHWRDVEGFKDIWEVPWLRGTNQSYLTGFFCNQDAILLATRLPLDPQAITGLDYPGKIEVITDPGSGLSVLLNQYIDQATMAIHHRLIIMFGVARGNLACGHRVVSSGS